MTDTRQYIRIEPARERVDPGDIVARLAGFRKLGTGWKVKYDPRKSAPTFEFLALTQGDGAPVRFYLGVDDEGLLPTVQSELQTAYPASYDIHEETVDIRAELRGQGRDEATAPTDRIDPGPGLDPESDSASDSASDSTSAEPADGEGQGDTLFDRTPIAARWRGVGERSRDWMTPLKLYSQGQTDRTTSDTPTRAPLATAIERLTDAGYPTALQVLFTRYGDWQKAAKGRKKAIETKHDGALQSAKTSLADMVYGADDERVRDRRRGQDPPHVGESTRQTASAASGEVASRQALIDQKGPSQTFLANLRVVTVLPEDPEAGVRARATNTIETLANSFNHLDGYFYHLEGHRVTKSLTNIRDPARVELKRLVNRRLTLSRFGKRRPHLVVNADELANFVAVPSVHTLTTEGERGVRGKERLRQPLPLPTPDMLDAFSGPGMAVGKPLQDRNDPLDDPIRIPPALLTTSYLRAASTGSGKSKATQNDLLSLADHVPGPTVLLESKGDGMAENYLSAHYAKHGDLDDVYYFNAPETLPAVSFFDIRPALAAGRTREDAVQDKVEHFHEIMRLILGEKRHEQAFVANEILTFLIKALFDREYGQDAFSLEELIEAVSDMSRTKVLPEVCDRNEHIEDSLVQKCQVTEHQFQQTMGAAANRLDKLVEHEHLYRIFTHVPEWDPQAAAYEGNAFDFREFINEDAVILFNVGELRVESRHALTMVLLSNLWDAVQGRHGQSLGGDGRVGQGGAESAGAGEPLVNMIIEEAAAVATSSLVYEQFIPQGRAFGVSLGLIMQYPEQVALHSASDRPYTEILNNVKTKLIGNIATDAKLAESLAHENLSATELRHRVGRLPAGEWIAQLPSPHFGETGPPPFSLVSLPIPDGHPESDAPLSDDEHHLFEERHLPRVRRRTHDECSLPGHLDRIDSEDARAALDDVGEPSDAAADPGSGGTAADDEADPDTPPETPFFGAVDASDDAGGVATDDATIATADTPSSGSSRGERDIGDPPTFGRGAREAGQQAEGATGSASGDQAPTVQADRTGDGETGTAAVAAETTNTADQGDAIDAPSSAGSPEHVSHDADTDHYVCTICGSTYPTAAERTATACCQFASKDDVFAAARRARATADTSGELFRRLGTITEQAASYGIEVTIQDFASLESVSGAASAPPDGGDASVPPAPEQSRDRTSGEPSARFSEATTTIPDETLREEGVTRDEAAFLGLVLDAMNHQLEDYSLLESMASFDDSFASVDTETLKEKGFLEEHRSFRQKYYTVLPAGRDFLDRALDASPGVGDLGEKTPHKAGVAFLGAWLDQYRDVDRTEYYVEHDGDTVFDVAGFDATDELCWVGEVETASHNLAAAITDYQQLADVDAKAAWAFEDRTVALDVLDALTEAGLLDLDLTATQKQTVSALRAAIGECDTPGLTALHTFRSLTTEVDTDT